MSKLVTEIIDVLDKHVYEEKKYKCELLMEGGTPMECAYITARSTADAINQYFQKYPK